MVKIVLSIFLAMTSWLHVITDKQPITFIFAGDTMMDESVKDTILSFGVDYPFSHVKSIVEAADYAILNLETAITTKGIKFPKLYNYRSNPESLAGIKNAGFDLVSIANNHSMDYSETGLLDTLHYLQEYQISYVGAGINEKEAYKAKRLTIKGRKISILGFSRVLPKVSWYARPNKAGIASGYQQERVIQLIKEEKKKNDFVFVFIHWGTERTFIPEKWQESYARDMIDAGADAVVGSHPHVLQTFDVYNGKPIAYSLGNFLFPNFVRGKTAETGLLRITIDRKDQIHATFLPFIIKNDQIIKDENRESFTIF